MKTTKELDYLHREAEAVKTAIDETMRELKASMRGAVSPSGWARQYPWISVGLATVAGLTVAGLVLRRRGKLPEPSTVAERLLASIRGKPMRALRALEPSIERRRRTLTEALIALAIGAVGAALRTTVRSTITAAIAGTGAHPGAEHARR